MIKILTIIGARPQFVKSSIVSKVFNQSNLIDEIIVHTGQHFDFNMNTIFFDELNIPSPKYNLNINQLSHGEMTGKMLAEIEKIIINEKPDYVLVYGDTNSTLAGALAAKKLHVKIIHVEAGLRSFNMEMPEEINRILTDRISDVLFCPTLKAVKNLKDEGFENFECTIENSGDVMFDVARLFQNSNFNVDTSIPGLDGKDFILCTIHREENTNNIEKLKSIINALNDISKEVEIVLPLHPRTKKIVEANGLNIEFKTHEPFGYFEMMNLLTKCSLVVTDSGGLQKEAFFFQKYCVTLREQTEWTELVDNGFNQIAGANSRKIYDAYKNMINKNGNFDVELYGDGTASKKILETIKRLNNLS